MSVNNINSDIRISEQKIKMLSRAKYAGLFLDESISFKHHLDTIKLIPDQTACYLKLDIMLENHYLEQYNLLSLISNSDTDIKSG